MAEEKTRESRICYGREFLLSFAHLEVCKNVPADLDASILREIECASACIAQSGDKADHGRRYRNSQLPFPKPIHDGVLGSGALSVCLGETASPGLSSQNVGSCLKKTNEPYRPPHLNKNACKADHKRESCSTNEKIDAHKTSSQEWADGKERKGLLSMSHESTCTSELPDDKSDQTSLSTRSLDLDKSYLCLTSSNFDQSSLSNRSTESDQSYLYASRPLSIQNIFNYFPEKNVKKTGPLLDVTNVKYDKFNGSVLCSESSYLGYKAIDDYNITELDKRAKMYSSKKFRTCQCSFDEFCLPDEDCLITKDDFIDRQNVFKSSKTDPFLSSLAVDIAEELLASEDFCKENNMLKNSDWTSPKYHATSHILTSFETDQNIWNQPFYSWLQQAHLNSERANDHIDSRAYTKSEVELIDPSACLFDKKGSLFSSANVFHGPVQGCDKLLKMEHRFNHPPTLNFLVQKGGHFYSRGELPIDDLSYHSILPPGLSTMEKSPLQSFYRIYGQHGHFGN